MIRTLEAYECECECHIKMGAPPCKICCKKRDIQCLDCKRWIIWGKLDKHFRSHPHRTV